MKRIDTEPRWRVGVVVPARDEEDSIVGSLRSIRTALDRCGLASGNSWITVVADSCSDATPRLARNILGDRGSILECSVGSAGAARRLGAAHVLEHFAEVAHAELWIANTDADTCVDGDWVVRQLALASQGYCGVAGVVQVDAVQGLGREDLRTLWTTYTIHSDGTHPHVHGANLGVRADAYIDAGCWTAIAVAEDHCLWSRVRARGWPTMACSKTVVHTSGRLQGRAVGGFADTLRGRLELFQAGALPCTR